MAGARDIKISGIADASPGIPGASTRDDGGRTPGTWRSWPSPVMIALVRQPAKAREVPVVDPLVQSHRYPNGLVLVAETMPGVQSGAFTFLLPAGAAYEPADRGGTATMLAEWIMR